MNRTIPWLLCGASLLVALPTDAAPPDDPNSIVTVQVENDAVSTLKGTSDQYYTSGLRVGFTSPTGVLDNTFLGKLGHAAFGDGTQRIAVDITQSIFTPRDTQLSPPDPTDRPYAGYLTSNISLIQDSDTARNVVQLSLGVIGPDAQGEEVQNGFHSIIGDTSNKGWDYQLPNEFAIETLAERTWRYPVAQFYGLETDVLPSATVGLGNVRDYVQAGVGFRLGQGLRSDFGPPRIRPGLSGADAYVATRPFVWYVFGGVDGQLVAHDEFIDGETFHDTVHVQRKPEVGEFEAGLGIIYHGVRVSYTQVWQTDEFHGQKGGLFSFGSLAASVKF